MDEYISRESAKKAITNRKTAAPPDACENEKFVYAVWNGALDNAWFEVDRLPSADVKPVVRGEWSRVIAPKIEKYWCSECKGVTGKRSNFCPNCGAEMRKEEKQNE